MWSLYWGEGDGAPHGRKRTVLESSGKPEEEVARKPEKKKRRFKPTGRSCLGKGRI